jgi:hypothetical protein
MFAIVARVNRQDRWRVSQLPGPGGDGKSGVRHRPGQRVFREAVVYFHPVRVLWVIWSVFWAAIWTVGAIHNIPHHACTLSNLLIINGHSCAQYGSVGNPGLALLFAVFAVASVGAAFIPVGPGKVRRAP